MYDLFPKHNQNIDFSLQFHARASTGINLSDMAHNDQLRRNKHNNCCKFTVK